MSNSILASHSCQHPRFSKTHGKLCCRSKLPAGAAQHQQQAIQSFQKPRPACQQQLRSMHFQCHTACQAHHPHGAPQLPKHPAMHPCIQPAHLMSCNLRQQRLPQDSRGERKQSQSKVLQLSVPKVRPALEPDKSRQGAKSTQPASKQLHCLAALARVTGMTPTLCAKLLHGSADLCWHHWQRAGTPPACPEQKRFDQPP